MEGALMKTNMHRRRVIEGPPLDPHAEELAGQALEALARAARLRRALGEADKEFARAARIFRRYYDDAT